MQRTTKAGLALLALVLAAGCSGRAGTPPTTADTTSPTKAEIETADSTPQTTPTPTETPLPAVGEAVTDTALVEACQPVAGTIVAYGELADGKCPLEMGQRVYVTEDGTALVVDRKAELPDAVLDEISAVAGHSVHILAPGTRMTSEMGREWVAQYQADIAAIAAATGKTVVEVLPYVGSPGCAGGYHNVRIYVAVTAGGFLRGGRTCAAFATADEAFADAQAFIAAREDATTYLLVRYSG